MGGGEDGDSLLPPDPRLRRRRPLGYSPLSPVVSLSISANLSLLCPDNRLDVVLVLGLIELFLVLREKMLVGRAELLVRARD